tara:strand:+ start:131 stop:526 length:396 start_codon:yes stop_codon:yes gene_type:complete
MPNPIVIPEDVLWGDAATAINHNTDYFVEQLDLKLDDSNMRLQSDVAGSSGPVTINLPMGRVIFATGATSLVVTNSLVTALSNVFCTILGSDTAAIRNVIPSAGSFNIVLTAGASAPLSVAFMVVNPAPGA